MIIIDTFIDEMKSIKNSYYKLLLISLFPLLSYFLIISIFYDGVLENMPIVVVDKEKSQLSKGLIRKIDATKTLSVAYKLDSLKDASALVQDTKAYALVIIPRHFTKDTLTHKQPKVTAMVNTQYILVGKIITSTLNSAVATSAGELEFVNNLVHYKETHLSKDALSPIKMQITPFFNTYQNYFLFLVSALLPSIWQIFIVIVTIVSFGELVKSQKDKEYFRNHTFAKIVGKMLPYTLFYMLLGALYLFYIYGTLGWAFEGSFAVMILAMFLSVVAYQGIALLFLVSGFDYARSLSLGAVYTAPAFAFLGVTFPVYNMNDFALFWRDILPISYYIELQISQANYGVNPSYEVDILFSLLLFWFVFIPVYIRFKQRVSS